MNLESIFNTLKNETGPIVALFIILILGVLASLFAIVKYFLTLQRTMNAISPALRPMPGGLIWLALLPFLGMVWYMIYVIMLSSALKKELAQRTLSGDAALGITVGTACLLALCITPIPVFNWLFIIPTIGLGIVHWQRMTACHRLLTGAPVSRQMQITRQ